MVLMLLIVNALRIVIALLIGLLVLVILLPLLLDVLLLRRGLGHRRSGRTMPRLILRIASLALRRPR